MNDDTLTCAVDDMTVYVIESDVIGILNLCLCNQDDDYVCADNVYNV